ncbi:V-type ATP synthase subunit A [Anaeromyxobacter diazotrophicus]|uniref:V-type ATP synthase alpha chain n=1 Tax=Anaeromyxobacter diazotrophicus TaxID=2590199 RepID=A0A7I9VIR4_9BACT|nr:V-type ATP synthase subunit A [Anaeromyxobacter diazotrophicus]GEJ56302.1 V-type ATP synthase alpha chain [Anaeromyxobacter diazotrophicus]
MPGELVRVAGPMAVARGLGAVGLNEVVLVGAERLTAEVIRVRGELATLQVYEDTAGLGLLEPATPTGAPLEVELGPGLLGRIFDGLQRPLDVLARSGDFLGRGERAPALDRARRLAFTPQVRRGDPVRGGQRLGVVRAAGGEEDEPVLAPPDADGVAAEVRAGEVRVDEPVVILEGGRALAPMHRWPVRRPRPVLRRLAPEVPFLTGQRILDVLFPVAEGGTAIVPGGFGTGKTVLEQALAKFGAADVIVYVGCGERGNEMAEVLEEFPRLEDPRTGRPLMSRTVMVVNTSNMPVAGREASISTGFTLAEYFRDLGLRVALMIDSTSRWAEALREISARLEELPGEEGYPTSLGSRVAQLYERAGRAVPLSGAGEGSITVVGAVSPPGGDFSEPVTQAFLRATGAVWALSADLAHRRHFPAVDWTRSWSLDAPGVAGWFEREAGEGFGRLRAEALRLLSRERELLEIAQLVGMDALQDEERLLLAAARLVREGFLRQNAYHPVDRSTPPARARAMLSALLGFHAAAAAALGQGAPLEAVLRAADGSGLARLGELSEAEIAAAAAEAVRGAPWTS